MKASKDRKKKILVVDDEEDILKVLDRTISDAGFQVFTSQKSVGIYKKVREIEPDLILLDIMMTDMDGIDVKKKLNEDASTASIPVIFLTAKGETDDVVKGLELGADDYMKKPFDGKELLARINMVISKKGFYEDISMTDGLTGLDNVKFFNKEFSILFNAAKRYKETFSLAIIDIDGLKKINDTYGHVAGDFVLKTFSAAAKETFRKADIVTRYGGDEFVVLMPETDLDQAGMAIERLKGRIVGKAFECEEAPEGLSFAISSGIATYDENVSGKTQMFKSADSMLYQEKSKKKQ